MNCGLSRRDIFLEDKGRESFLDLLSDLTRLWKVEIYAYCLMDGMSEDEGGGPGVSWATSRARPVHQDGDSSSTHACRGHPAEKSPPQSAAGVRCHREHGLRHALLRRFKSFQMFQSFKTFNRDN